MIGADLVPTESNYDAFRNKDLKYLLGENLLELLTKADFRVFNLEVPLTDRKTPISKCGPALNSSPSTIEGIKAINPNLLAIANNHILDQGEQGLISTITLLDRYNIPYVGAGLNINDSAKPYIWEKEGMKIGFYCCAEHEFTIVTSSSPGANPFDPLESLDHITQLKKECDFVITLYHGGKEHYRYPSPYLQKVCRKIVDKGSDLVVCQHSHCIGCKEDWNNGSIIYGQGNFIFDDNESPFWQTSLLLNLKLDSITKHFFLSYIPVRKNKNKIRLAQNEDGRKILRDFEERSTEILEKGFIEEKYSEFSQQMISVYYSTFLGSIPYNILYRIFNKLSGYALQKLFFKLLYKKRNKLALQNFIECEAHRELLVNGLKNDLYGLKK